MLTAVVKQIRRIQIIFFAVFLCLNNIIIPRPAFTNNPASKAPKDKLFSINNSLNNKLEAQLGIKPIIEANSGERYLFMLIKLAKFSSPTKPIKSPNKKLIAKTYPNISNE